GRLAEAAGGGGRCSISRAHDPDKGALIRAYIVRARRKGSWHWPAQAGNPTDGSRDGRRIARTPDATRRENSERPESTAPISTDRASGAGSASIMSASSTPATIGSRG